MVPRICPRWKLASGRWIFYAALKTGAIRRLKSPRLARLSPSALSLTCISQKGRPRNPTRKRRVGYRPLQHRTPRQTALKPQDRQHACEGGYRQIPGRRSVGKCKADIKTGRRGRAIVEGGRGTTARSLAVLGAMPQFAVGRRSPRRTPPKVYRCLRGEKKERFLSEAVPSLPLGQRMEIPSHSGRGARAHKQARTTDVYAHFADDPLRAVADRTAARIAAAMREQGRRRQSCPAQSTACLGSGVSD